MLHILQQASPILTKQEYSVLAHWSIDEDEGNGAGYLPVDSYSVHLLLALLFLIQSQLFFSLARFYMYLFPWLH